MTIAILWVAIILIVGLTAIHGKLNEIALLLRSPRSTTPK